MQMHGRKGGEWKNRVAPMKQQQQQQQQQHTKATAANNNAPKTNSKNTSPGKSTKQQPAANQMKTNNKTKHQTIITKSPSIPNNNSNNNNNNNSIKNAKKKQKRSAKEIESQPTIQPKPIVALKATDFPALQAPPKFNNPTTSTKLNASSPPFPAVATQQAPTAKYNPTTQPSNNSTKMQNKPGKQTKSASNHVSKPTKASTIPQKQSTLAAKTNTTKNTKNTNTHHINTQDLPQGQEHALLRLMQQGKMVVVQKGRQRIKPRKKKFSALKKKVLEERLRQWRSRNENTQKDEDRETTFTTLAVLGWLTADDDWNDEDEYAELCTNFQEMADKIGPVQRIYVPRRDDAPSAGEALHAWNGLSMPGTVLQVMALSVSENDKETSSAEEEAWRAWCEQSFQEKQASMMQMDHVHEIGLWNALTEDDLEDDECLEESMDDIRVLATSYGPLETLRVEKEESPRIFLVYKCNLQGAKRIVAQLNQVTLSGNQLLAKLIRENETELSSGDFTVILRNVLTAEDLEDEECLEESMGDIEELAKQFGVVEKVQVNVEEQTIAVHYTSAAEKEKALTGFHGMVIGGLTVSASTISGSENSAMEPGSSNRDGTLLAGDPMFSGDKRIPERFAECKRVPKIPNSGQARHYSILSENETVKPLLTEMLAELMRLQKRAAEDKNAKAKRRLVMGLREVARGIRARKVRMVVMANNLDEYGALDEKLQEILDMAQAEEVPVFFEFSKRALGKAIGKTIKMAVIGIQNPDGANQQFKKLSGLAPTIPVH